MSGRLSAIVARIRAIRRRAVDSSDAEVTWLSEYALRLVSASARLVGHMGRLSSSDFAPRVDMERALTDQVPRRICPRCDVPATPLSDGRQMCEGCGRVMT